MRDEGAPAASGGKAYVEALLAAVREHVQHDLPYYSDAVRGAFVRVDPVFTRESYRNFFFHCASTVPGWIQRTILTNGKGESEGSEGLFRLWQAITYNDFVADQVLTHATDEARHSRMFVNIASLAFPRFMGAGDFRSFADSLADVRAMPRVKTATPVPEDHLIDHLVQMNIGEIRTRLHMHLFAPVVSFLAPAEAKRPVEKHLRVLARDEMRHIGYTALLMEAWAEAGDLDLIRRLYLGRLNSFNKMTVAHTRDAMVRYGHGKFPDLLEI